MRALNFGVRTLQSEVTEESVGREIDRYDAADAAVVSDRIRASAGIEVLADQYISLYERILGGAARPLAPAAELGELATALSALTRRLRVRSSVTPRRQALLNLRLLRGPLQAARWLKRRLDL